MAGDVSAVSRRLKEIRGRAGLSIREVAEALGMEHGSSYQHYEDRYRKPLLPLDLTQKLVPIVAKAGADWAELYALAGVDATGTHLLGAKPGEDDKRSPASRSSMSAPAPAPDDRRGRDRGRYLADPDRDHPRLLDRARQRPAHHHRHGRQHGAGAAAGPAHPGRYRRPEAGPAGHFRGVGRARTGRQKSANAAASDPVRVKITSDNPKYDPYERTIDEAYIQGRVLGQWRWL